MKKYDGYQVGPILRSARLGKNLSVYDASALANISVSTLRQIEQGGRNLTLNNLYVFMQAYEVDANTLLGVPAQKMTNSVDGRLAVLPPEQRDQLKETFDFLIGQVERTL